MRGRGSNFFDDEIIDDLKKMLDECNPYVNMYRMARDRFKATNNPNFQIRLINDRLNDGMIYNLPTSSEVAAFIVGDTDGEIEERDIVIQSQTGMLQRISELHPCYLPL